MEKRLMLIETRRCLMLRHASWRIVRAVHLPQLPATTTTFNHSARSSAFTHLQISCCLAELSHPTAQCQVRSSKPLFWSWDPWTMFGGIGAEASVVGAATTSSCRVYERVFTTWKASCLRDMRKNTATRKVACFAVSSDMLRCSHA